jgi:sugar lactone lactonase YvrE
MKVPLGGGQPSILASRQQAPAHIAIDIASVYWMSPPPTNPYGLDDLWRVFIGGGTSLDFAPSEFAPGGVAVDATNLYWTTGDGQVRLMPVGGGTAATMVQEPSFNGQLGDIAVNANFVYWTSPEEGTIWKAPLHVGLDVPATAVATLQNGLGRIVLDSSSIYWTATSDGTVMKASLDGGTPTTLAVAQSFPTGIAVDGANVYWTNYQGAGSCTLGAVMRVPIGGGQPTVLAANQLFPDGIAVDGASVYWTVGVSSDLSVYNGAILKVSPK